jgi:hypothetical protein
MAEINYWDAVARLNGEPVPFLGIGCALIALAVG